MQKVVIFFLGWILLVSFLTIGYAEVGYNNPSIPKITKETPTAGGSVNNNTLNINSSQYWGSYFYSSYNMPVILSYAYNQTQANAILNNTKGGYNLTAQQIIMGTSTLNATEWSFLDGQNQQCSKTSSPQFTAITIAGTDWALEDVGDGLQLYSRSAETPGIKLYSGGDIDIGYAGTTTIYGFFQTEYITPLQYLWIKDSRQIYFGSDLDAYIMFNKTSLLIQPPNDGNAPFMINPLKYASDFYIYGNGGGNPLNFVVESADGDVLIKRGSLTVNQSLIVGGNITGSLIYGEMKNWSEAGHTATPSASAVYNNMTNLYAGLNNGFTIINRINGLGGTALRADVAGVYKVTGEITASIANGGTYGFGVVVNSANPETSGDCYRQVDGGGLYIAVPISCLYRLNKWDNLTVVYDDEANPVKALTIKKIEVNAWRVGN